MGNIQKVKRLNWGVAGCGKYAETAFIPTLEFLRKSSLESVFSHSAKRAKELHDKFGATGYYSNYDEFLSSGINALYIGSVNADHYEQAMKAAEAGINILCEKPLALSSKQAAEIISSCEKNNVLLAVNYVLRFCPPVIKAKEFLDLQMLGKLTSITMNFNIDIPPSNNFRFNKQLSGGGALRDLGTHMIDLMRFFGGEIVSIDGVMDNIVYKSDVEDFASATVKFKNSGYGHFFVSFNNKKAFNRVEIIGHKGAVAIDNLIGKKNIPAKLNILLEGEGKKAFRRRGNKQLHLLKSVQNSFLKSEQPQITGYDGLVNLELMEELENKCRK